MSYSSYLLLWNPIRVSRIIFPILHGLNLENPHLLVAPTCCAGRLGCAQHARGSMKQESNRFVPFVNVEQMCALVSETGAQTFIRGIAEYIEEDFKRWENFQKSPRSAAHYETGVIELMPASNDDFYAFKYVNGHPVNMKKGLQTVAAFGMLSRVDTGYPVMLSEMTVLTALRTAATSAVAAKYLAPPASTSMAMIGNGAQCEFQALAFKEMLGIKTLRLYDIDPKATEKVMRNLKGLGLELIACTSSQEAVSGAHIITTCTADKQYATILTDNMVGSGVHINAIGGDCPGKTELHKDILLRSDIFVEFPPQTRIEGEIQQLDEDHPVTELWQVIDGQVDGRKAGDQITLFDSVGFAIEDFSALRYVYDVIRNSDHFDLLDLVAEPGDPRDIYGLVKAAA